MGTVRLLAAVRLFAALSFVRYTVGQKPEPAFLIAGVSSGLIRLPADSDPVRRDNVVKIFNSTDAVIAVDTVYKDDDLWVYWSSLRQIHRGKLVEDANGQPVIGEVTTLVQSYLESVEALRIDWINDNLYWVDSEMRHIEVACLDGSMRSSLFGPLGEPRGLALDPHADVLFWSDWNDRQPCIERSSLAGKDRRVIVNVADFRGGLPNGLTLDLTSRRVFWIDALSKAIHSTGYEGTDHSVVQTINSGALRPFSIDSWREPTDGQVLIWTNMSTVFRGLNEIFNTRSERIFYTTVVHRNKKPNDAVKGRCKENNGNCSHLCSTSCLCPYGTIHDPSDVRSCIPHRYTLLYATKSSAKSMLRVHLSDSRMQKFIFPPLRLNVSRTKVVFDAAHDRLYWFDKNVVMCHFYRNQSTEKFLSLLPHYHITSLTVNGSTLYISYSPSTISTILREVPMRYWIAACSSLNKTCSNVGGDERGHVMSLVVYRDKLFWSERTFHKSFQNRIKQSLLNGSNEILLHVMNTTRRSPSIKLKVMENRVCFTEKAMSKVFCVEQNTPYVFNSTSYLTQPLSLGEGESNESIEFAVAGDRKSVAAYAGKSLIHLAGETQPRNVTDEVVALDYFSKDDAEEDCACPQGVCVARNCVPAERGSPDALVYFLLSHRVTAFRMMRNLSLEPRMADIHAPLSDHDVDALHVANNGRIYVTIGSDLYESRLDGTDLKHLLRLEPPVVGKVIAISSDLLGEQLYLATGCAVFSMKSDGSDLQTIVDGAHRIMGLAVHPAKQLLFWSDAGGDSIEPKIERVSLDDPRTTRKAIVTAGLVQPTGIAVEGDHVFWGDSGAGVIGRADLEGRDRVVIAESSEEWNLLPVAVAVHQSVVFWLNSHSDNMYSTLISVRDHQVTPSVWSVFDGQNATHLQFYDKSAALLYHHRYVTDSGP